MISFRSNEHPSRSRHRRVQSRRQHALSQLSATVEKEKETKNQTATVAMPTRSQRAVCTLFAADHRR